MITLSELSGVEDIKLQDKYENIFKTVSKKILDKNNFLLQENENCLNKYN